MKTEHYRTWAQARKHAQLLANETGVTQYAFQEWSGVIAVEMDYPKSGIEFETFIPKRVRWI